MAAQNPLLPNIIVILTDDLGPWALGCAGNDEIRTPNLDRLASQGIYFENFFCASPVCSPARASLLTGRIPSQHGVHDWIRRGNIDNKSDSWLQSLGGNDRRIEYLAGLKGYSDFLAAAGYSCALSGKWHLGDSLNPQKSFEKWYTHAYGGGPYYGAPMIENGKIYNETNYVTDAITARALQFLDESAADDAPFYLSVHYTAPHSPWDRDNHPHEIYDSYRNCPFNSCPDEPMHPRQIKTAPYGTGQVRREILQGYFAAVTAMDTGVGKIMEAVNKAGINGNTLIFFTSDNGMNMGHHGIFGKGNGTFPQNMYEESVKVPAIISQPGVIPQGLVSKHLLSHYDFMPTLLDYLNLDSEPAADLPGVSFAPLLRGKPYEQREDVVVFDEYGPVRMIRTEEYKYIHRFPYGPHEFYDLVNDPAERFNLVNDPNWSSTISELRGRLALWFSEYAEPARDGTKEAVYGSGQLDLCLPDSSDLLNFHDDVQMATDV